MKEAKLVVYCNYNY